MVFYSGERALTSEPSRQSGRSRTAAEMPADTQQEVEWLTHRCQAGGDTMWNTTETLSPTEL